MRLRWNHFQGSLFLIKKMSTATPTVEDIYQKKTQLEHILLRPDTYIGSVEATSILYFYISTNYVGI